MLHHDQTVIAHFNAQTDENFWQNILILSQYLNDKEIYLIFTIVSMGQFGSGYPQSIAKGEFILIRDVFQRLEEDTLYFFSGSGLKSKGNICFLTDLHTNRRKDECQTAFRVCDGIKSVCESQKQQLSSAVENLAGASRETEIHHCSGMQRWKGGWLSPLRWSEGEKCADTGRQLCIIYVKGKTARQ